MASDKEFVKIYRKLLENPIICKDNDHLAVWMYLLLTVEWKECEAWFNNQRITLKPGQGIFGRKAIAEKLHISESKCERVLTLFKSEQQIEQQTSSKSRLITILNWGSYQKSEQQNEQQVDNKWTTSEQQVDTNRRSIRSIKKNKNIKNEEDIGVFAQYSGDNLPLLKALEDFDAMRKDIKKPMSDRARQLLCVKLTELSSQGENIIDCLNESVLHSWQGVFAKKKDQRRVEPIPDYNDHIPGQYPKVESTLTDEEVEAFKERLKKFK